MDVGIIKKGRSGCWAIEVQFPATTSILALGFTQSTIQCIAEVLSLWTKQPEREADYSHPSSAEV